MDWVRSYYIKHLKKEKEKIDTALKTKNNLFARKH